MRFLLLILSNDFSSKTPLHLFIKDVFMYVNSWMTLFKEIQLYMSALGRRNVYSRPIYTKWLSSDYRASVDQPLTEC